MLELHQRSQEWLSQHAVPLWLEKGIDWRGGGFFEILSLQGEPVDAPKRTMVQARQIYSFRIAEGLRCVSPETMHQVISHGLKYLMDVCSLASGAFVHSVDGHGKPHKSSPDLYTQAFALFGLAQAYAIAPEARVKERAKALVNYLKAERQAPGGGYFELGASGPVYESNPLMHLFEAALSWMDVDQDGIWKELANELAGLALNRFIDAESGALAEHFEPGWTPIREQGRFVFEPGHQYEWAWLFGRYQKHSGLTVPGARLQAARIRLFELSEKSGLCRRRKTAYDELWSDLSCKSSTSRFWPQCERIKAAVQLGVEAPKSQQKRYHEAADEAISALFRFLETPRPGLWFDRCTETSEFATQPAKASSLYHIIGALHEYLQSRPR